MIENKKDLEYPYNLIYAVFGEKAEEIIDNSDTITDFKASVEYILCTLTEREKNILKRRFAELKKYEEIGKNLSLTRQRVKQIETKALRKMGHPNRAKYLIHGVSGVVENIQTRYYNKFIDLESKLIALCKINEKAADKIILDNESRKKYAAPIYLEDMDLSVRAYNCLKRVGVNTLDELSKMDYDELIKIRNLGKGSAYEIMSKLNQYGYEMRKRF